MNNFLARILEQNGQSVGGGGGGVYSGLILVYSGLILNETWFQLALYHSWILSEKRLSLFRRNKYFAKNSWPKKYF